MMRFWKKSESFLLMYSSYVVPFREQDQSDTFFPLGTLYCSSWQEGFVLHFFASISQNMFINYFLKKSQVFWCDKGNYLNNSIKKQRRVVFQAALMWTFLSSLKIIMACLLVKPYFYWFSSILHLNLKKLIVSQRRWIVSVILCAWWDAVRCEGALILTRTLCM